VLRVHHRRLHARQPEQRSVEQVNVLPEAPEARQDLRGRLVVLEVNVAAPLRVVRRNFKLKATFERDSLHLCLRYYH